MLTKILAMQLDRDQLNSVEEYYGKMAANIREMLDIIRAANTKTERVNTISSDT